MKSRTPTILAVIALGAGMTTLVMPCDAWTPPDGGPGGACSVDRDCPGCGWVCSAARGGVCIPSMEGDPGRCVHDSDCVCPGQTCAGTTCTPGAHPDCACNSDCPAGQVCDQILFQCHAQPAVGERCISDVQDSEGACGCGFGCNGTNDGCFAIPSTRTALGPECLSDIDCNACQTGWICVPGPVDAGPLGSLPGCVPGPLSGWCMTTDGGMGGADAGNTATVTPSCGCSGESASVGLLLLAALLGRRRRRH